jgi:hypothetical protein
MGVFEQVLNDHAHKRHVDILGWLLRLKNERRPQEPDPDEGFLSPPKAAEAMNVTVAELVDMVRGGLLEWREVGREVYVRPAVVSLVKVRT